MTARFHQLVCAVFGLALLAGPIAAAETVEDIAPQAPQLEAPRLTGFVEANYPAEVASTSDPVEVELELVITAGGKVTDAKATAATGSPFEAAAVEAARKFQFEPAKRDGKPVPARIRYRYVFAPPAPPPAPTTGVLEGRVMSSPDTPVAHANVAVTSEDGSPVRTFTTIEDGAFRFD